MACDSFTNENTEFAVPTRNDCGKFFAVLATHLGHSERAETLFNSVAHAMNKRVTLLGRNSERVCKVGAREALSH